MSHVHQLLGIRESLSPGEAHCVGWIILQRGLLRRVTRCVPQVRTGLSRGPWTVCWMAPPQERNLIWTPQDTKEDGSMEPTTGLCPAQPRFDSNTLYNYTGLVPSKSESVSTMHGLPPVPQHWVQRIGLPHLHSVC